MVIKKVYQGQCLIGSKISMEYFRDMIKNIISSILINPDDSDPKSGMIVIVEGNRISLIGKTENVKIPHKTKIINASGKYIIPGLWDMHVHIVRDELDKQCRDIFYQYQNLADNISCLQSQHHFYF